MVPRGGPPLPCQSNAELFQTPSGKCPCFRGTAGIRFCLGLKKETIV